MSNRERLNRYTIFILGLLVNSLGVSLITKAELGTSPISSIPYVLSLNFPLSLGAFTVIFSLFLILLQLLILKRDFKLEHVLQIPVSLAFGIFIDMCMTLIDFVHPENYAVKCIDLVLGCLILGVGVYMEVLANVVMLPGEAFVRAIVFRWNREFGVTKVAFDVSMTIIAGILSFAFSGKLYGVREGTIVAAVLVGFIARLIGRKLSFLPAKLFPQKNAEDEQWSENNQQEHICIAIGRQYGSGGHDIGQQLASELSFEFYDRDIIRLAAGSTGYTSEFIGKHEEKMTNSLLYDLAMQMYAYSPEKEAPEDAIFEAERKIVLDAAEQKDCVIVGRCADVLLRDNTKCLRIFLYAPLEYRIKRVMATECLDEVEAKKKIQKIDRRRAEYYRYYTHQIWGLPANHHICIDTSIGTEQVKTMILKAIDCYLKG
ncbi:MAG TPA: cytidylate kinase family protein [Candidatus Blautia stercoravium]|nr:cytidylate kinase family protein [Candidatus Blautia stercoravium]